MINFNQTLLTKNLRRYCNKNTINGQYRRSKHCTQTAALLTGVEILRLSHWGIADIGLASFIGTSGLKNLKNTYQLFKKLKPIKQRAKSIYK